MHLKSLVLLLPLFINVNAIVIYFMWVIYFMVRMINTVNVVFRIVPSLYRCRGT